MREALLALIEAESLEDAVFNDLALQIYRYQFSHNAAYRKFCLLQEAPPDKIHSWEEIPPLPITAFKFVDIACRPFSEAARVFHSSGTTRHRITATGNRHAPWNGSPSDGLSRHAIFDLEVAHAAIVHHFKQSARLFRRMHLFILTPSPMESPHSSLSYMMEVLREAVGTLESDYYIHQGRLLGEKLAYDLSQVTEPIILLGTSFSFVHFIDFHQEMASAIRLPPGSRLMDTGGFKGRSRTVSRPWLYAMIENRLGIPEMYCINEYGMSEMTSQFYDGLAGERGPRVYMGPPQTRWRVLHPETLKPVKSGEVGLLAIYDLANIDSALALLTDDQCRALETGFEWIGRAAHAEIKGCSMTFDTLFQQSDSPIEN